MRSRHRSRLMRRPLAALAAGALLVPLLVLSTIAPASAAFLTPRYVRSIGGMGRPGVFAWGTQWNPVTNEMLVGDYLHFKVRRYDLAGNHLGDFWNDGDCGQPYTVGVDPRDGRTALDRRAAVPLEAARREQARIALGAAAQREQLLARR